MGRSSQTGLRHREGYDSAGDTHYPGSDYEYDWAKTWPSGSGLSPLPPLWENGESGFSIAPASMVMYQDTAGTIPVAQAGDPVGLIRDESGNGLDVIQDNDAARPTLQRDIYNKWYLDFNGADTFMYIPTLALAGSSEVTVIAGVEKDPAAAGSDVVVEHSDNYFNNNGTFRMLAPASSNEYNFVSKGTTSGTANIPPPFVDRVVLTGIGDIANDVAKLRANGQNSAENNADQGTGPYLDYPLYVGARAGTALQFLGKLYSLSLINRLLTDDELSAMELYHSERTGVYFLPQPQA